MRRSELRLLNKQLLAGKDRSEGCRPVVLNIDDTICTVYGDQEGAGVVYNPKKNGRQSFKEKVGILASTNVRLRTIYGGNYVNICTNIALISGSIYWRR